MGQSSDFLEFTAKDLPKVNASRRAMSQPDIWIVPQLDKASVQFVSAHEMQHQPCSCYNCHEYNETNETCQIIGPHIRIRKFVYGEPDKEIEYWPSCGAHLFGEPNRDAAKYKEQLVSPDHLGLCWINAPKVGQKWGGANCGGVDGGDDCDYYMIDGSEGTNKPDYAEAFCQVLQENVEAGAVCAAFTDDDLLSWQLAQNILRSGQAGISEQRSDTIRTGLKQLKPRDPTQYLNPKGEEENGEEDER